MAFDDLGVGPQDEEEEDDTLAVPGTVGANRDPVAQLLALQSKLGQNAAGINKGYQLRLQRATDLLKQRRLGPSLSEQLFALSGAFASPKSSRGLGGTLANVMPVLGRIATARRQGNEARDDRLMELSDKYEDAGVAGEQQSIKDQMGLLALQAKYNAPPKPKTFMDPLGRGVVSYDGSRASITPFSTGGADDSLPVISSPEEARRLAPGTEFKTPDGRHLRVPGGPTGSPSGTFRRNIPSGNPLDP